MFWRSFLQLFWFGIGPCTKGFKAQNQVSVLNPIALVFFIELL